MSRLLFSWLMMYHIHTILALFKVTAPKSTYTVQYGDTVKMTCKFPLVNEQAINELKVSWEHQYPNKPLPRQVVKFNNGKEDLTNQDSTYRGRATLLSEELEKGEAILQIENVRLTDAGNYLCLLQLDGSDYYKITLEVLASYKSIQKSIRVLDTDSSFLATCHSLGFPKAEVYWRSDDINVSSSTNTTYVQTVDGFYNTTSTINILDISIAYKCVFWNKALKESTEASVEFTDTTLYDPFLKMKILISCIIALLFITFILIICYRRRCLCFKESKKKGSQSGPL